MKKKKLVKVTPYPAFTLILEYEDGERRIYDCRRLLEKVKFLRDYENFRRVYIDGDGAICWDRDPTVDSEIVCENKVDLCPDSCYVDSRNLFAPCDNPRNYEELTMELDFEHYLKGTRFFAEFGLTLEAAAILYLEDILQSNSQKHTEQKGMGGKS